MKGPLGFIASIAAFLTACTSGRTIPVEVWGMLESADSIEVHTNLLRKTPVRRITDAGIIKQVIAFYRRFPSGWRTPFGGAPIAGWQVYFHKGDTILATFGVGGPGQDFITASAGLFDSRSVTETERLELLRLLGVGELDPQALNREASARGDH